jgi:ribose 1,5-bisphosphokinase PhnN
MRPGVRAVQERGSDNSADFLRRERSDSFRRSWRADVNQGSVPMAVSPFVRRLSVVTAYVAFAFVGAIVLGVF